MRSLTYDAAVVILTRSGPTATFALGYSYEKRSASIVRFRSPEARRHHACDAPLRWADMAASVKRVAEYVNAIRIARYNIIPDGTRVSLASAFVLSMRLRGAALGQERYGVGCPLARLAR